MKIKPIPCVVSGVEYRSKLEGQWAAFFETLGVRFEYEPEAFRIDERNYLPDFYLPSVRDGLWIEVKPKMTKPALKLCQILAEAIGQQVLLLVGSPRAFTMWDGTTHDLNGYLGTMCFQDGVTDYPYLPCVCSVCGLFGFEFEGRGDRVCGDGCCKTDKGHSYNHYFIEHAATMAISMTRWTPEEAANRGWKLRKPE